MSEENASGRRGERFVGERRAEFFRVLAETGNARTAAHAIGMDRTTLERRRKQEPELDRQWTEALDAADARLSKKDSAFERGDPFQTIRRGSHGKMQLAAVAEGRWTGRTENAFIAALRRTGNVSAAARAIGFSYDHVWERRRQWPGFARRWEEALDDAEIELEFRMMRLGNNVLPAAGEAGAEAPPAEKFDPEFALRFLKWREEKRAGGGRRGRGDCGPRVASIEEVKENILRKIEAIERHRNRNPEPRAG